MNYYLAIDIGASSGRHVLGHIENNKLIMEEIYRFENKVIHIGNNLIWDIEFLLSNIISGLKMCKTLNKIPIGVGIDTFGVDYVLLDQFDKVIGEVFSYRDNRTILAKEELCKIIDEHEQYQLTGIQPQVFNTVYQIYADKLTNKLHKAKTILMLPSFLNYYLSGIKRNEFTISSTTGMLDIETNTWNERILETLGISSELFSEIIMPGEVLGEFRPEICNEIGFKAKVFTVPSHDTASAVSGSFTNDETIFLSSGTWSLMGIITDRPINSESARRLGFTNEGNYDCKRRFLKNIMGLWIIQEIRRELNNYFSFPELVDLAYENKHYNGVFDVTDNRLLAPINMKETIFELLKESNQPLPESIGELCYCVFNSLSKEYAKTVKEIELITNKKYEWINIVGGGSKNYLLNQLTEKYTCKKVLTGPYEATSLGNLVIQMIANKELTNLNDTRKLISNSI